MPKFEILKTQSPYASYFWRFKAANGETLCHSESYNQLSGCMNGVKSAKENAPDINQYNIWLGSDGQWYWNLRARNGQILCHSEGYTSRYNAGHGLNVFRTYAPTAIIAELV